MPTLDSVGIVVTDMATTLAFYRLLGIDIPDTADEEEHVEVQIADGFQLLFDTVDVIRKFTEYDPPKGGRNIGFAFRCKGAAEVDRVFATVCAAGYSSKMAPFDAFWGQRYASLLDPDGNPVDLYATATNVEASRREEK